MHLVVSFTSLSPHMPGVLPEVLRVFTPHLCGDAEVEDVLKLILEDVTPLHQHTLRQRTLQVLCFPQVEGLITFNPDMLRLEVRLRSDHLEMLKGTCAKEVSLLMEADSAQNPPLGLGVQERIVVQGDAGIPLLTGTVTHVSAWQLAFHEEDKNTSILKWGLSLVLVLQTVTFPHVAHHIFAGLDADEYLWVQNFLGRLASAAMFGSFLAFMNIRGRKKHYQRSGPIIWRPVTG